MQIHQTTYLTWMQRWNAELQEHLKNKRNVRSEISSNKVLFEEKMNFSMLSCFFIIEVSVMVQKYYNFHFFNFKKILKEYQCQETMKWNVKRYCPAKGIQSVQILM